MFVIRHLMCCWLISCLAGLGSPVPGVAAPMAEPEVETVVETFVHTGSVSQSGRDGTRDDACDRRSVGSREQSNATSGRLELTQARLYAPCHTLRARQVLLQV